MNRKSKKSGEKHAGRFILSYKLDLKAANLEQTHKHTHTQSEYCNPRAHARRALINERKSVEPAIHVYSNFLERDFLPCAHGYAKR